MSYPFLVQRRALTAAVAAERASRADCIGAAEHPILPGGETAEDLCFHRLGTDESHVRLHGGERVGAEGCALLERDAQLVFPVDGIGGEGHQPELRCRSSVKGKQRCRSSRLEIGRAPEESRFEACKV